jgi:hypothetical protein
VTCIPNTAGQTVTETFVIEELGKSVSVKHSIKKGKEVVSEITAEDCKSFLLMNFGTHV